MQCADVGSNSLRIAEQNLCLWVRYSTHVGLNRIRVINHDLTILILVVFGDSDEEGRVTRSLCTVPEPLFL